MCVEVCPKDVKPMDRILQLREMAIDAGIKNNTGAATRRHLHEVDRRRRPPGRGLAGPGSVGMFNVPRLLKEVPGALQMPRVGKLPIAQAIPPGFPMSHKMEGMERVKNVIRKSEQAQSAQAGGIALMLKYAFWPGCVSKGAAPELYHSTKRVAAELGIELVELDGDLHRRRRAAGAEPRDGATPSTRAPSRWRSAWACR